MAENRLVKAFFETMHLYDDLRPEWRIKARIDLDRYLDELQERAKRIVELLGEEIKERDGRG